MVPLFSTSPGKWKKDSGFDQKSEEECDKWRVKIETGEDESQPSINLDLGIGGPSTSSSESKYRLKNNTYDSRVVKVEEDDGDDLIREREKQRSRNCSVLCFTQDQLFELQTQLQIFKFMVSGLPVPFQLLLPIWSCFSSSPSSSLSPLYFDLRRRSPFLIGLSNWGFDNRYLMDSEPWRCRRTDGKKWRCHQRVIPNEKYCERHMHRGSKRSRKLVESSTQASPSPKTFNLKNSNPKNNLFNDLKIKLPANLNQKPELPTHKNLMKSGGSVSGCSNEIKNGPTRVVIKVPSSTNLAKRSEDDEQKYEAKCNTNSIMNERITAISFSSGLDFSPKSVLQGQKLLQAKNLENEPNDEAGRCRRTDGKKWRCRRAVLPGQKYCVLHINRGTKRAAMALSSSGEAEPEKISGSKFSRPPQAKLSTKANTGLTVSLTVNSRDPGLNTHEDNSGSTSETTITDDSAHISDMVVISP